MSKLFASVHVMHYLLLSPSHNHGLDCRFQLTSGLMHASSRVLPTTFRRSDWPLSLRTSTLARINSVTSFKLTLNNALVIEMRIFHTFNPTIPIATSPVIILEEHPLFHGEARARKYTLEYDALDQVIEFIHPEAFGSDSSEGESNYNGEGGRI